MASFSSHSSYTGLRTCMTSPSASSARRVGSGSVYGKSGGSGVRIVRASEGGLSLLENINIAVNERATMQNLNERLASYLEKVRRLEDANGALETNIRRFMETRACPEGHNFSSHSTRVRELQEQTVELNQDVAVSSEGLQTSRSEVTEIRQTLQTLQIKLQAQSSKKGALEATLSETNSRFTTGLFGFQKQVAALEEQLTQLRADLENQGLQYSELLDIKIRLELEITLSSSDQIQ